MTIVKSVKKEYKPFKKVYDGTEIEIKHAMFNKGKFSVIHIDDECILDESEAFAEAFDNGVFDINRFYNSFSNQAYVLDDEALATSINIKTFFSKPLRVSLTISSYDEKNEVIRERYMMLEKGEDVITKTEKE